MHRAVLLLSLTPLLGAAPPANTGGFIFPPEKIHNHASSIVELPGGELFACWYHGSGERTADDVLLQAARLPRGASAWQPRFTLADTPGFPDTNPVLFVDSHHRLWLFWQLIVANQWHTAVAKYRISTDYRSPGPPRWSFADDIFFIPRNFEAKVKATFEPLVATASAREKAWMEESFKRAGDKYFSRMGWMNRVHPLELPSGRILVPLYSDGYSFSLVAITDDGGRTWTSSEPLAGPGNVQPSLVRRNDGTIAAYMRDNGPPPKRVLMSESKDEGVTWSPVVDSDIPNPGSSVEVVRLRSGQWCMINNDTGKGRHSLAVWLSDDEGATWKWKRHIELDPSGKGSYSYPSLLQTSDGWLHATYSHSTQAGQSIMHRRFNVEWIREGDR
jgi:predicted neuraminidase